MKEQGPRRIAKSIERGEDKEPSIKGGPVLGESQSSHSSLRVNSSAGKSVRPKIESGYI